MNYYNTRYVYDKKRKDVWRAICEYLQKFIPESSVVLDFGSGYCDFINQIKASKKIAVDINPESKKYCKKDVTFLNSLSQVKKLSIKPDTIFMSNILEHMNDEELDSLFLEMERTLKPGFKIVIIQPNYFFSYRKYWDDYTHKKAFSHESLVDFLNSKGFEIVKVEKKFLPFSMKSKFPKSYWLTKIFLLLHCRWFAGQMLVVARHK